MICPYCHGSEDKVIDTRSVRGGESIRRRRECLSCRRRFTTYERVEPELFRVIKADGRREAFSRQKLLDGLLKACEKRPVSVTELEEMVDEVETMLHASKARELTSGSIGEYVMSRLRLLDEVAYVRFASVYRRFRDAEAFQREVEDLQRGRKRGE
ncbi:MAG: transcriptional repressor NrdR [Candidatus Schekmanbacteria bacterium]|nr:transcriptional repressor NrdR [Candidatus Schekmanbacteria bacterium]